MMNHMRKKAALKKYAASFPEKSLEEIKEQLEADEKEYTEDEVVDVLNAIEAGETADNFAKLSKETTAPDEEKTAQAPAPAQKDTDTAKPAQRAGTLQVYTRYKVERVFQTLVIKSKKEEVLTGFKKKGEALNIHKIEPRHAEILNQQVVNTLEYYFAEGEDDFLPAERFF